MTDRTRPGEAPGSAGGDGTLDGSEYSPAGASANGANSSSPAIRPDGGDPSGGLFDAIPDPVLRYELEDESPVVTGVNAAYRERFEVAAGVTGPLEMRLRTDLERPESSDGPVRIDDVVDLVESAESDSHSRAVVRADTQSGERDYLARVVSLTEADEAVRAAHGPRTDGYVVLTDVTAQLERTRDLVEQRDRLDEFASIVSHDLRNPLEVAKIQLEAAWNRGDDVHFEKVEDAHERIERIIEDVLALARQGQVIDDVDDVSLATVAADAWDSISAPGATMAVEEDVVLQADGDRLQELLENLFRNAVEHGSTSSRPGADDASEHAGPEVTVTVGRTDEGFYVADDGPGIPEADRQAVFEGGFSTDPDGTGLGLVIVESIAEAHDWSIAVGDAEGGGARFDVSGVEIDP